MEYCVSHITAISFQLTRSSPSPFVQPAVTADPAFSFNAGRKRAPTSFRPNRNYRGLSSKIPGFPASNFGRQFLCNKPRTHLSNKESSFSTSAAGNSGVSEVPEVEAIPSVFKDGVVNGGASAGDESGFLQPPLPIFRFDGSLTVHAGERSELGMATDGITTPIVNTSAYWFKNTAELIDFKEGRHDSFEYGRYGNPTSKVLEEKMSALEKAESTLFVASGMHAFVVMMLSLVPPGGHIITTADCYRETRMCIENQLRMLNISATVIDSADIDGLKRALDEHMVSLFFTETPTNPLSRCVDIELVSELCHSKGTLVCIDSTFASPINQKPLTFGADLVLHSATKFLNGHSDALGGCISGSMEVISKIRKLHHVIGGVINPTASYMILRGMKTLKLRVQQQNTTAMRMAQFLENHRKVSCVYYPGLLSHLEHNIARKQMSGFGGVISFEVEGDLKTTSRFVDSLNIPYIASSFGGCESLIGQSAIMSYWDLPAHERIKYGIKDNLIRFCLGIEDFEDLKEDVSQALEKI